MFPLTITAIDHVIFQGLARFAICPGAAGELTVLRNHAPLITSLKKGTIRVATETGKETFGIEKGFLAVHKNETIILVS